MRAWLLLCVLAVACGEGRPAPATRVRLWAEAGSTLTPGPPLEPRTRVFASRFGEGLADWEPIITPWRSGGALESRLAQEDGRACVDLSGVHGGLHTVFPVEPDTCYVFTGRLRTLDLEPAGTTFDGARFWLAQASGEASFAEFRTTRIGLMTDAWSSPGIHGRSGWQEARRVFVTKPDTRLLHIVCALATEDDVRSGGVRFADLALEKISLPDLWLESLREAVAARAQVDPPAPGGQSERRVAAELRGETRPAVVLLPGERLTYALPELAPAPVLELRLGPWAPALLAGRTGSARLRAVARDGAGGEHALLTRAVTLPERADDGAWVALEAALPPDTRALELSVEGDGPLAIGAPLVRAAADGPHRPNVLLVSIDTLRADHVGCYGATGARTPNLDRLAARGLRCADASAQAPYTLPSHASILTGQFPSVHGVVAHESTLGAVRSTSLAELLARAGYATRAFTAGGFVNAAFGLDQGFDGFSEIDPIREADSHYYRTLARKHGLAQATQLLEEQGFAAVLRWLDAAGPEPFFLFLHTYTVHDYDGPRRFLTCSSVECAHPRVALRTETPEEAAAYTPEMRAHVQHLYDGALAYTDERLGTILARLEARGLLEETLVVVTSDHGEEFFEHGNLQHGRTLYEELLSIPLLFAGPGVPARTLERPAMQIDVAPTVLARLGLAPPPHAQGIDLLGRSWPERAVWSEVESRFARRYALRTEAGEKTIHGPLGAEVRFPSTRAWELYELAADPREQHDLAGAADAGLPAAREGLESWLRSLRELGSSLGSAGHGEVDPSTLRDLDGLGYGGE